MQYPIKTLGLLRLMTVAGGLATFACTAPAQPPGVPSVLEVPAGNEEYLRAGAKGTQNYLCMPTGWTFIGPQATLTVKVANIRDQVATHFLSPNPQEDGTARATWQSSYDTSSVWATAIASSTAYAEPGAIPWLLLEAVGTRKGHGGASAVSDTTYIQRMNTTGGMAPATACTVGTRAFVPYTADYVFFRKAAK